MKRSILFILFVVFLYSNHGFATTGKDKMEAEFYRGTLNLVIGNAKGVVVATDSRATIMNQNRKIIGRVDSSQKLFQITKDIAITIAGYGSATVNAAPEFTAPAAAIISSYVTQIKKQNRVPSYWEVIEALTYLMNFRLTSVASINQLTGLRVDSGTYIFRMIVIGRNKGIIIATKVTLESRVIQGKGDNYVESNNTKIETTEIKDKFVFKTAGLDRIAINVLGNPDQYMSFPEIRNYADHIKKDGGRNLTISELKDIAETIMDISKKAYEGIGGQTQKAIFENDSIYLSIPSFQVQKALGIRFNLMTGGEFRGKGNIFDLGSTIMLFISNNFDNTDTKIDNCYYYGNNFHNCVLHVNSGSVFFDKSNKIQECELVIGNRTISNLKKIKELKSNFKWKKITITGK
jgi:hypothetical protein